MTGLLATIARIIAERGFGLVAAFGTRGLEAAAKFGLYALAARLLGGEQSGEFFLCLTVVHFTTTLARLGLEKPLTRHVAAELAVGRGDIALKKALSGSAIVMASSLVFSGLLALLAGPLATGMFHQPDLERALLLSALIVPLQNIAYTLAYLLIGLDRGAAAQFVMNALPPTLSLGALVAGAHDVSRLLMAYSAAFVICSLLGGVLVWRAWTGALQREPPPGMKVEALPSIWASARPLLVVELAQAALLSVPIFALGHFASQVAVSEFSIANRLTMLVSTVVLSIGSIVAPAFARHHRRGENAELRHVNRQVLLVSAAICLPVLAVMVVFAHPLLALLGSPSQTTVNALMILAVGQLVFSLYPCQDTLLAMTGHGDVLRRISIGQLAVAAVLCAALIPAFGVIGAAIASSAIWALGAVSCGYFVSRVLPEAVSLPVFRFARP